MATNMDLVSIATTFLVLYLYSSFDTGNAGIIRRDVPPLAKNCSIDVVAFIPFDKKTNLNESVISEPKQPVVHESYPNPPVPTPPSPIMTTATKPAKVASEPEMNDDGTKKWGFDDKYLASQNKYAAKRNVVFDVIAGDSMSFSNYNVLGHQEVGFHRRKK